MKTTLLHLTFVFFIMSNFCSAQDQVYNQTIDSLISVAQKLPKDSNKVILLNKITDKLWQKSFLDSAYVYAQQSLFLSEEINYQMGKGNVLTSIGIINAIKGNYPQSTEAMKGALDIFIKLNDPAKIASTYNNLGNISEKKGDYSQALEYHLKSLKQKELLGDTAAMSSSYNNIGIALKAQGENLKALEYYKKSLAINEQNGNTKAIAQAYNNMGSVYQDMSMEEIFAFGMNSQAECYAASLACYTKSLELDVATNEKVGTSTTLNNIGSLYYRLGEYDKALTYNMDALEIRNEIGDKSGQAGTLSNLSRIYLKLGDKKAARKYGDQSLFIALEIGAKDRIKNSYKIHSEVDSALGDFQSAFENYKLYTIFLDSILSEESKIKTAQLQMQFEFDKKAAADSVHNAKFQELQEAEIAKKEAELSKQNIELQSNKTKQYYLFGGLFFVFIFSGFMYNRSRVTSKQNKLIELQKKQVEHKNLLLSNAHDELTEKNKEILDSIVYAKRIQRAILPPKKLMDQYLHKSFVLYKPKDIVAGDFYWLENKADKVMFAAADCTGHGVPGAMVSVICNNGLNRSVREHGLVKPSEILDKTREIVIEEFNKSEEDVNDGMDISLCSIDFKRKSLEWSGANNSLIIIREGELIEYKPNKQPIGKYTNAEPFSNHQIELHSNDLVYVFTDGFYDQFGGEKGKKFLFKRFKELLLESYLMDISMLQSYFLNVFNEWKGENEQVDDVCIIGVRIV